LVENVVQRPADTSGCDVRAGQGSRLIVGLEGQLYMESILSIQIILEGEGTLSSRPPYRFAVVSDFNVLVDEQGSGARIEGGLGDWPQSS
jgi:hypothetical protein